MQRSLLGRLCVCAWERERFRRLKSHHVDANKSIPSKIYTDEKLWQILQNAECIAKTMDTAGDVLRQAFMSKEDYDGLREETKVWRKLQRPLCMIGVAVVWAAVVVALAIMLDIVFAVSAADYPFCQKRRLEHTALGVGGDGGRDGRDGQDGTPSYAYTEEQAVQYFWLVVFLPSSIIFAIAVIYLFAGIAVAYTAPERHGCLKIVENNCCASKRGGVKCLATLNISFLVVIVFMAIFLGSSVLTLGTECSIALFWCYQVACWGLITLLAATIILLRRKAAIILDAGEYYGQHAMGVELLEATAVTPEMQQRMTQGFKSWMGPSQALSSSDDEESGGPVVNGGLDDVWEEGASEMFDAPQDFSRSRMG